MANLFIILSFCLCLSSIAQTKTIYPDNTKKTYYSAMLDIPTTRGGFLLGIERCQKINNLVSFTSSFNFNASPVFRAGTPTPVDMVFCLQPFHLLVGKKQLKFETGLSVSYLNPDINNSPRAVNIWHPGASFMCNIYFGIRYNFKRIPFHAHLAYVPFIDSRFFGYHLIAPDFTFTWFNPFGFEFGIGYIFHKSQAAQKRREIRNCVEESH